MTSTPPVFIGCACDRRYVEPTAVMLSSVDLHADLPDAVVLVCGLDLDGEDRALLRAGAGRLGSSLRFVDVTSDSLPETVSAQCAADYPISTLGRLFLPSQVTQREARLISLDSDVIVNSALGALVEMDLGRRICAAVHDVARCDDRCDFNLGLMAIDVDAYNARGIAVSCLRWISSQDHPPPRPDRDALNAVIGDDWLRLDGGWSSSAEEHRALTTADYDRAAVAHFAGRPKPWDFPQHAGASLYNRHHARLQEKLSRRPRDHRSSGREFLATCYEVLLGRELEDGPVIPEREAWPAAQIVHSILESPEFRANVLRPLGQGRPFREDLFFGRPTMRQRFWAADQLPVSGPSAVRLLSAPGWSDLLSVLLSDPVFAEAMALPCLPLPDRDDCSADRHAACHS